VQEWNRGCRNQKRWIGPSKVGWGVPRLFKPNRFGLCKPDRFNVGINMGERTGLLIPPSSFSLSTSPSLTKHSPLSLVFSGNGGCNWLKILAPLLLLRQASRLRRGGRQALAAAPPRRNKKNYFFLLFFLKIVPTTSPCSNPTLKISRQHFNWPRSIQVEKEKVTTFLEQEASVLLCCWICDDSDSVRAFGWRACCVRFWQWQLFGCLALGCGRLAVVVLIRVCGDLCLLFGRFCVGLWLSCLCELLAVLRCGFGNFPASLLLCAGLWFYIWWLRLRVCFEDAEIWLGLGRSELLLPTYEACDSFGLPWTLELDCFGLFGQLIIIIIIIIMIIIIIIIIIIINKNNNNNNK